LVELQDTQIQSPWRNEVDTKLSEADVIKTLEEKLSALEDNSARQRVLRWAVDRFATPASTSSTPPPVVVPQPAAVVKKPPKSGGKPAASPALAIIKDLNLKPTGKTSFKDFVAAKGPASNQERCLISVYYLKNEVGLTRVGANHVYTCFKVEGWRVPADLVNTLQYAASQSGWFDTKDREDIKLTTHGENHVEHDMPRASSVKKTN
jgi:hypothetical protein